MTAPKRSAPARVLPFPTDPAARLVTRGRHRKRAESEHREPPAPSEALDVYPWSVVHQDGCTDGAGRYALVATDAIGREIARYWAATDEEREWAIEWLSELIRSRKRYADALRKRQR